MYFDAAVVYVTKFLLLFILVLAILWAVGWRVTKDFFIFPCWDRDIFCDVKTCSLFSFFFYPLFFERDSKNHATCFLLFKFKNQRNISNIIFGVHSLDNLILTPRIFHSSSRTSVHPNSIKLNRNIRVARATLKFQIC